MSTPRPDELAIDIQVTPQDYRNRGILFLVVGLLLVLVSVGVTLWSNRGMNIPFTGLLLLGYGVYCVRRARRQIASPVLHIDRSGIMSEGGVWNSNWDGVAMIWVGSSTGLRLPFVSQLYLHLFTRAGLHFARRAGTAPKPVHTVPLGGGHNISDLCRQL